jgi:hypothetical protein
MATRKPHIETIYKTKNEKFNISFTWKTPDIEAGATIASCVASVIPATGLTLTGAVVIDVDNNKTTQMIDAGIIGGIYRVAFKITTSAGQSFEAFWDVHVI